MGLFGFKPSRLQPAISQDLVAYYKRLRPVRMWLNNEAYDEGRYIQQLRQRGSPLAAVIDELAAKNAA